MQRQTFPKLIEKEEIGNEPTLPVPELTPLALSLDPERGNLGFRVLFGVRIHELCRMNGALSVLNQDCRDDTGIIRIK